MTNIELLKHTWDSLYAPETNVAECINKFFHSDYEQSINGVILNRSQYIEHVIEQRANVIIDSFEYKHVIEKDNDLFALYYPKGKDKANHPFEAEVIAYFCFSKEQILRIHGQVRIVQGNYADVDMSR